MSLAVRYFFSAVVAAVAGYLVDAYLPLQPLGHVLAIICYVGCAILVVCGLLTLVRGGPVV